MHLLVLHSGFHFSASVALKLNKEHEWQKVDYTFQTNSYQIKLNFVYGITWKNTEMQNLPPKNPLPII